MSIRTVGVIGTGVIGASWTALFLAHGCRVLVSDPASGAEKKLSQYLKTAWPALENVGLAKEASLSNYRFVGGSLKDHYKELDFVQENAPERVDLKIKLFAEIDASTRPDVVIASSSSGIPSSRFISQCTQNPGRWFPIPRHKKSVEQALEFYRSLGRKPVLIRQETPGFAANRLQAVLCNEAYSLVSRGILSAEDLDTCVTNSLGLRWAVTGPLMANAMGGGGGSEGFRHLLEHLGPATQTWLQDMKTNAFNWSSESLDVLEAKVSDELKGKDIEALERERDELLVKLLQLKSQSQSVKSKLLSFNKAHKPLITIESGDVVSFDNTNADFGHVNIDINDAKLAELNLTGVEDLERLIGPIYVNGPVFVNGAEPGDILQVEILELQPGSWGWTMIFPGIGLFKDEITGPHIKTFDLQAHSDYAVFGPGIHIPKQPFYGTMGVAPAEEGDLNPLFPRNDIGGNFDCRYLGEGAIVYLPVNVPGALFSAADGHYCQGDGEITGTALETTMRSRIRLSIIKGKAPRKSPHYKTNPEKVREMHSIGGQGEYGVLAHDSDREVAVKQAVSGMLDWLVEEKGLKREEAYMLFSMTGNLKTMHDLGLELATVSASIPLGIFVE
ncbi:L-carnitine dehydrogenase [Cladobotryum mycophilum]|uniref:L-carnitine dehydrogenase n=1 Tax=Cladobotryum mycophilum TaxID=491253 RepID=A0ABR0SBU8_9HYPO